MEGNEEPIREMLQRFARAFTSGDGPAAAACWDVPALIVQDDGSRAVTQLSEVASFFAGAKAQYNAQGVYGTRADVTCVEWHTPAIAAVTVHWPYLDGDGREVGRNESSVYLVRVKGGTAKIFGVILRGTA